MNIELHRAKDRGQVSHGWLQSAFSFSFAEYYNPARMGFGQLRVINDDIIAPGQGFPTHPHRDMEIITIPLEGDLEHRDSMGNHSVIRQGDIQVMSAGTGITHSEYNANGDRSVKLFQIWVLPKEKGVTPRYDQIRLPDLDQENTLHQVVSPDPDDDGVWIHQDAWFHMGRFSKTTKLSYQLRKDRHGVFVMVVDGKANIGDVSLSKRDAVACSEMTDLDIAVEAGSRLLLMEIPMR